MRQACRILDIHSVTHDVKCFRIQKPAGYSFTPGQATDVSILSEGYENELRPFTFTALNEKPYLEFTIKRYADHKGVTDALHQLRVGDELMIGDPWGAISYQGAGYFIAGGAGITPFIAILRHLHQTGQLGGNKLLFSNKTAGDIIYGNELKNMLGDDAIFTLTQEKTALYDSHRINAAYLKDKVTDFSRHFYICGPDAIVAELTGLLQDLGAKADTVVFEK